MCSIRERHILCAELALYDSSRGIEIVDPYLCHQRSVDRTVATGPAKSEFAMKAEICRAIEAEGE